MQEDFTKNGVDFKKGSRLRKINEDPTFLSWFVMFDYVSEESPLFNGAANTYLEDVIGGEYGKKLSENLTKFRTLLSRINTEMPWFWQTISGLDAALQYGNLEEPFWGASKPQLEIECLEENVDLTAFALMDLYKRATHDFNRWVEIIPYNLRVFQMWVYVTEVRQFQMNVTDRNESHLSSAGDHESYVGKKYNKPLHEELSLIAKPFVQLQFKHCQFNIDSIAPLLADLGKNPEMKKPKIGIYWESVNQLNQKYGDSLFAEGGGLGSDVAKKGTDDSADPSQLDKLKDIVKEKAQDKLDALKARGNNLLDSFGGPNSEIGSVYDTGIDILDVGGAGGTIINSVADRLTGALFLGNVHGAGGLGTLQDAINAGSVNAIANLAGQLFGQRREVPSDLSPNNIYPKDNFALDSSPDGNISPKQVYDPIAPDRDDPINENVHE